VTNAQIAQCIT